MASLQVEVSNRQIYRIALPISLALLVPNLNLLVNGVFLGHLSEDALAVASITGVYYLIFSSVGYGLNNGLQALIARRAGENRPEEIGKTFHQGILVAMCIAALGIVLTYTVAPLLLRAVAHNPRTAVEAASFLRIRIWGLPFLFIYQMRNALLVGTNNSRLLIAGTLVEAVANVVFDYALIFGKLGAPVLGFKGAAYASIIAEFLGMFAIFIAIRIKGLDRKFRLFSKTGWDPDNIRSILRMSGPLVFQHAISIISWLFFYLMVERNNGQTGLAVSNAMRSIFAIFGVFVWAFAATSNAMVSNLIGQNLQGEVIACIRKIMLISLSLAAGVFVLLNILPGVYLSIYGLPESFRETGVPVIRVVSAALLLMSASTIWLSAVTGTGKSRITFLIELSAIIFYCTYVYLVLERWHLSLVWGWASEFGYWIVLGSLATWYMRSGRWKSVNTLR